MRRIAASLVIALMLAALAGAAQARPQPYPGIAPRSSHHQAGAPVQIPAATPTNDGPSWTVAILGGVAVTFAFGCAGVLAGRASVRPQIR
jgi:hypothetical protein